MKTDTAPPATEAGADGGKKPRSRKKLLLVGGVVLALVLGAGYWFVLRPSGPTAPQPGQIMTLESTQINLAGGHYLKVGLALQLTTTADAVDGSKALDDTIDLFSGLPVAQVTRAASRHALKKKLEKQLAESYDGDVMGVYFTEFVTQ
ncbi:MAG: flagellar basal body-associated FliL family protein [Nocardioides sp.]